MAASSLPRSAPRFAEGPVKDIQSVNSQQQMDEEVRG